MGKNAIAFSEVTCLSNLQQQAVKAVLREDLSVAWVLSTRVWLWKIFFARAKPVGCCLSQAEALLALAVAPS